MRLINTNGIQYIEAFVHTSNWYWGTDYSCGDLYEAEEVFLQNNVFKPNRLIFIHYPDGELFEPIVAREGQYFGRPLYYDEKIYTLLVDFLEGEIHILEFSTKSKVVSPTFTIPLSSVKNCYNLMLHIEPLMVTRQDHDAIFQIIWPECKDIPVGSHETFDFRKEDDLYFADWYEDENDDYFEEIVIRDYYTGEVKERIPGNIRTMPDGQKWILR